SPRNSTTPARRHRWRPALECLEGRLAPATASFDFSTPPGVLGNSQTYSAAGATITAYGFSTAGDPTALFGKSTPGVTDETGLGISPGAGSDNEIQPTDFVELDLANLFAKFGQSTPIKLKVGSVQAGEGYDVYGSNSLLTSGGSLGTLLRT